jgi:hypothetical protein
MGSLGWAPHEVDRMEIWQIARFMGMGGDPIIRGSRGLTTSTDRAGRGGGSRQVPFADSTIAARAAAGASGHRAVILRPPTPGADD